MSFRSFRSNLLLALVAIFAFSPLSLCASAQTSSDLPVSHFILAEKTQIPNTTLSSGSYLIRVLDHLSDRMVLQVEDDKGKLLSTFLALPNKGLQRTGGSGSILFGEGKKEALRGFSFENGTVAEFVYPKAQAVTIARQYSAKVPAIDPPSEGLPIASKMSQNDAALVTLWLLSPTTVGNESKPTGVLAERYQAAPSEPAPQVRPQPQVAQTPSSPALMPAREAAAPAPQVAQVTRKPVMAHLPHTAGSMPLVWLVGFSSLAGFLLFRWRRLSSL